MAGSTASGSTPLVPQASPRAADAPARAQRPVRGAKLRSWLAIDERPTWIAVAQTDLGRVGLFAVFAGLLLFSLPLRAAGIVVVGAAAAAFSSAHRDRAVLAATLLALVFDPVWYADATYETYLAQGWTGPLSPRNAQRLMTAGMFVLAALVLRRVARKPEWVFAKRPVLCTLGAIVGLSALCVPLEGPVRLWLVIAIKLLAVYMWFLCYAVVDQRSQQRSSLAFSLGVFRPFWGSSATPIGKGSGYLAKLRCKDEADLAVTQLKAVKLLAWSVVLQGVSALIVLGSARFGVAELDFVVAEFVRGVPPAIGVGWAALVLAVAIGTIDLAVWGHRVVACARLAGWKLRRNTVRPLQSRSLADFWNRYYYYFKELLLDFFFYPTFFRFFKKRPRLRTFCATFMAAGVGNLIYHFVRDIDRVFSRGPLLAISDYGSYVFYCFALASGIAISQVRTGGAVPRSSGLRSRVWAFACVWGFVVAIHVFGGIEDRTISFADRCSFLLHLVGV